MPRTPLTFTALLTTIAVASGCGSDDGSASGGASLAPAGAIMYGEATLAPEGDQRAALDALARKFPGRGDAGQRVRSLMEKAFSESDSGLSYTEDVEPWLGDEAAFFLNRVGDDDAEGAFLVATEDEERALAAVEKAEGDAREASYKDHDYLTYEDDTAAATVDGWLVIGSVSGFKAAVDTAEGGEPLEDAERYDQALADAPEQRLGFLYFDTRGLFEQLQRAPGGAALGPFTRLFQEPYVTTIDAEEDVVKFEATVPESLVRALPVFGQGSDLAGELPGDSWLTIAQPDLGETLDSYIGLFAGAVGGRDMIEGQLEAATGLDLQRDVLGWMGDFGLFVRGTSVSELNGALVVETSDEAASGRLIDAIARLARGQADGGERVLPLQLGGGGEGVTLRAPELPQPVHLFQRDGRVVFAYGDAAAEDALAPAERLADTAEFKDAERALGDVAVSFYLAVGPVLDLADSAGAASDEGFQEARPYLEPLGALAGGASEDGDKLRSAFGLTVP